MSHRELILMRHAKSDWANPSLSDHDRPLNRRGDRDAPRMAEWLLSEGLVPDVILCSSALRTQQTAELMMQVWSNSDVVDSKPELITNEDLYLSSPATIAEIVKDNSSDGSPVMVLAHNPGISTLASLLTERGIGLPTAGVVVLNTEIPSWDRFSMKSILIPEHVMFPKMLAET